MTLAEKGMYDTLLDNQWCQPRGYLPLDHDELARMCSVPRDEFEPLWRRVSAKFRRTKRGYYNARLKMEWRKALQIKKKRAESGRSGGLAKARNLLQQKATPSEGNGKGTGRKVKKGGSGGETSGGFPDVLATVAFVARWAEWIEYRRTEHKPAVTELGAKRSLAMLAKVGPEAAITAIDDAMRNGYQGLFPKKSAPPKPRRPGPEESDLTPTDYSYLDDQR